VDVTPGVFTGETEPSTLNRTFGKNMLGSEGAYHDRIRTIIEPAFRPGSVRPYATGVIEPIAVELIDRFADRGEAELMHEFAEPLSVRTLQQVLGLDDAPVETLMQWFEQLGIGASNFEFDPEKQAVADAASAEVDEAVRTILERLRDRPDDSILSRMLHAEVDGESLTEEEICANLKVMIVGGMQEPGDLVGIAMWALLSHPDQTVEVRGDANLVKPAVEEALRWQSPVGTSTRQTTRPTMLAGVDLDQGALIAAVVASANRDESHWPDPDRFDIHRRDGANLAFAIGSHHCVGAWLARYESRAAVRILLERLPGIRLDDERPVELHGWEFRRPTHCHVRWDA